MDYRIRSAAMVAVLAGMTLAAAEDRPRSVYVNPTQIWWQESQSEFVVLGSNLSLTSFRADGTMMKSLRNADPVRPEASNLTSEDFEGDVRRQTVTLDGDGKSGWILRDPPGLGRTLERIRRDADPSRRVIHTIPNASNARGLAVSRDGKFGLVTHLVPKSNLPSTQIEQGWVFTNAVSLVRLQGGPEVITLPLDLRTQGFANPEAVALSADGRTAWVAHAGADVVSVIDIEKARSLVKSGDPLDLTKTRRYVRARIAVGHAPAGLAVSADGKTLAVANRLSDTVSLIDPRTNTVATTVALSEVPEDTLRRGERLFYSGRTSHMGQFSCASCHPDGTTDGLNWDLPADGFNNFLNTKSLQDIEGTAPYGWLGTSATLEDRFTGTLRHLFQNEPTTEDVADLSAYLSSLRTSRPVADTPHAAGRRQFERAGCAECHAGPKMTDRKLHDVLDAGRAYDTPSLAGVRDTAPYLHDGRALTLESIFREHNAAGLHGRAADLTDAELQELLEYLESL